MPNNALQTALTGGRQAKTALGSGSATPPPPMPDQQAQQGGAPQQQQQQQLPPAPTHNQTVAALRHFQAIGNELQELLKNPDIGRADIKSDVIDGTTKLVSERIIAPATAVQMLSTFPDRFYDQKQWVQTHLAQIMQARNAVLAHHAQGYAGQGPQPTPDADNHLQDIQSMMQAHYGQNGTMQ